MLQVNKNSVIGKYCLLNYASFSAHAIGFK